MYGDYLHFRKSDLDFGSGGGVLSTVISLPVHEAELR